MREGGGGALFAGRPPLEKDLTGSSHVQPHVHSAMPISCTSMTMVMLCATNWWSVAYIGVNVGNRYVGGPSGAYVVRQPMLKNTDNLRADVS